MFHECRETRVLWVICDAEFDGNIHFLICPEERWQVKLGQISELEKSYKTWISFAVFSQNSKNVTYFYVRQLEMQKMLIKWLHHLPVLFWQLHSQT